jgi:hypothetical protein
MSFGAAYGGGNTFTGGYYGTHRTHSPTIQAPAYEDSVSHLDPPSDTLSFDSKTGDRISLWHNNDGFYYDAIGPWKEALRIKSLVGLIPLFAVMVLEPDTLEKFPGFKRRFEWFFQERKGLSARSIGSTGTSTTSTEPASTAPSHAISVNGDNSANRVDGTNTKELSTKLERAAVQNIERDIATENLRWDHVRHRRLCAPVDEDRLRKFLTHMLSETQFLSEHGIRSYPYHRFYI